MNSKAQVYAGDSWVQLPTRDLYDNGVMNMHMRALAETAARREMIYNQCFDMALDAFKKHDWYSVINNINNALSTGYYSGTIYYLRGYAYESLGNYKSAKKDYKTGKKYKSLEAKEALDKLKIKMKNRM